MARSATTTDAFAALAEGRRRELLGAVGEGRGEGDGCDVSWLVGRLGWPQPRVSKHLGVLLQVRLVSVEQRGRRRVYRVNGETLRPVFEWVKEFEQFWDHQLRRVKQRAEQRAAVQRAAVQRGSK